MVRSISRRIIPVIAAMPLVTASLSSCEYSDEVFDKNVTELREGIKADSVKLLDIAQYLKSVDMRKLSMAVDSALKERSNAEREYEKIHNKIEEEYPLSTRDDSVVLKQKHEKLVKVRRDIEPILNMNDSVNKLKEQKKELQKSLLERMRIRALHDNRNFEEVLKYHYKLEGATLNNDHQLIFFVSSWSLSDYGDRYYDFDYDECVNKENRVFHLHYWGGGDPRMEDKHLSYTNDEGKKVEIVIKYDRKLKFR